MTDNLRDRIAAAIQGSLDWDAPHLSERLADAVIEALTSPMRGCADLWHWSTGKPYRCPSCGYWMGEGYV